MKTLKLPESYMIARFIHLTKELSKLPIVSRGIHNGKTVYRIKTDGRLHTYRNNCENGIELGKIYEKRCYILSSINNITASYDGDINTVSARYLISPNKKCGLNGDLYRRTASNASPYENKNNYYFNGINYRSRGELMIAQVLTDMGLIFKYECTVPCGDKNYTADFLVYLPEFNRCFYIEYLGRLDDEDYVLKNSVKIRNYLLSGLYIGRDIILICGNMKETPTDEQIRASVRSILEYITANHLIPISVQ